MSYAAGPSSYSADHTIFLVGQDAGGHHCVHETHGLIGGSFISRAEAIRFAQDESRSIPGSVVLITPDIIEHNGKLN